MKPRACEFEAACLGKTPFDTWSQAHAVAHRYRHRVRRVPYKCSYCGKYHISSYIFKDLRRGKDHEEHRKH